MGLSQEEENKSLVRRAMAAANSGWDPQVMAPFFAADYRYLRSGQWTDMHGMRQALTRYDVGFPDRLFVIEDMIAEGDKVVVRYTWHGTHRGEFLGVAPTGREVTFRGTIVRRVVAGKIVEDWGVSDQLGLLRQIGAIPEFGNPTQ